MQKKRIVASTAMALVAAMALSGCSMGSPSSGGDSSSDDASGKTITVWAMKDDFTDETLDAINKAFEEKTGATANVEIQEWDGITTKLTTALSTSTPPDIVDLDNTQVSGFADSGALMDLTDYKDELSEGNEWVGGLEEPATIDGKLYAVPAFAAARAVVYNKTMWAEAGITEAPTTWDEFIADLDTVAAANADNPDFIPFYLPGQNWYSALQFIWDAGGDVASDEDGTWKGTASSAEAIEGMNNWKDFQNKYSSEASRTVDTANPNQNQFLADGNTAAILGNSNAISGIKELNADMTDDDLGTFAMPGQSGENQPSMVAGSDWAIAAKSQNQELAIEWVKIAASAEIQQEWIFAHDGWMPNSVEGLEEAMNSSDFPEVQRGFFEAAKNSKATPASPNWATIEGDKSINEFTQSVATGTSVEEAAKTFDDHLNEVLGE
ncbi:family 1 extracellular solute-binding protein [Bifidobacterium lemurum]|uniref:Family 1 extracellular solute-binding protein n=1 Tax=Bifidobacterium lemurum TaxID=1603886 RepID=A0A261FX33_9BIFI|nr:extracellular solute-binding protein [Bifidobacterium lemurum]OZG63493.1 family 1 extracellular solute-binding protein [Bifidobacterium lemurum]QOL34404.1 extracellular solute-binding protein [Bifidobacterium lemurum]